MQHQNITKVDPSFQNLWLDCLKSTLDCFQNYDIPQSMPGVYQAMAQSMLEVSQEALRYSIKKFEPQKFWEEQLLYMNTAYQHTDRLRQTLCGYSPENSPVKDKRFRAQEWNQPWLLWIRQMYELQVQTAERWLNELSEMDPDDYRKIKFYVRQYLDACSPSLMPWINPEVASEMVKTNGESLLQGLSMFLKDLKAGQGQLKITMTDTQAFEVGKNLATTEGEVIYQNDLMQLIQYRPLTEQVCEKPLLIIPPWINKFYILDLQPKNSLVRFALEQGFAVFMISWVNPQARHAHKDLEDYMKEGPLQAAEVICKQCKVDDVNALGFCIGGTLLGMTLAYEAAAGKKTIQSATYLTTLLDFSDPGDLKVFIDDQQIQALEKVIEEKGYLKGGQMAMSFNSLRANDLIWNYYVNHYLCGRTPAAMDLLYWNGDSTNMPAKMHIHYLKSLYLENALVKPQGLQCAGIFLDLNKITVPSYFLSAEQDHIAPWKTTFIGAQKHRGSVRFVLSGSGHIAGVVNPPSAQKYYYRSAERFHNVEALDPQSWYASSQEHPGSWWNDWAAWLQVHSGGQVKARDPRQGSYTPLEQAPGSYVREKVS